MASHPHLQEDLAQTGAGLTGNQGLLPARQAIHLLGRDTQPPLRAAPSHAQPDCTPLVLWMYR